MYDFQQHTLVQDISILFVSFTFQKQLTTFFSIGSQFFEISEPKSVPKKSQRDDRRFLEESSVRDVLDVLLVLRHDLVQIADVLKNLEICY